MEILVGECRSSLWRGMIFLPRFMQETMLTLCADMVLVSTSQSQVDTDCDGRWLYHRDLHSITDSLSHPSLDVFFDT